MVIHAEKTAGVTIPAWVVDLESFRRWTRSPDFPPSGRFCHLKGELWVDLSMERSLHNLLKTEIVAVLRTLTKRLKTGRLFSDGMLLTNVSAQLSCEPDGMFISANARESGRVRLIEGDEGTEVEGEPDMTLEVISPSSVLKDTQILMELYWQAKVREYWLVDPTGDEVTFSIYTHTPVGYARVSQQRGGWLASPVFGKSFRLVRDANGGEESEYTLKVR